MSNPLDYQARQVANAAQNEAFRTTGANALAGVIEATEEERTAARMKNNLNMADLLSKVPALSGVKLGATPAEREQAKFEAFAKIEIGAEIGLKPAESLRAIYFDHNGAGIDIHTRVAKALATGRHRFEILHLHTNGCSVRWFQKRDGQWHACEPTTVTRDQLKTTMVWEYDKKTQKSVQKPLVEKFNYKSYFEDMAYGFVQRRNVRRYAPETQGSFALPPAEEADMEDAGMVEGIPMTQERMEENVVDMTGSDGTEDTTAQDLAKAASAPEALERAKHQALLQKIGHIREDLAIATGDFFVWVDNSEHAHPCGLEAGLVNAPLSTLLAVRDHLHLHKAKACTVLLGGAETPDTPPIETEQEFLAGMDAPVQDFFGAPSEAVARSDQDY